MFKDKFQVGDVVQVTNKACLSYTKIGKVKRIVDERIYVLFSEYIGNSIYKTLTFSEPSLTLLSRKPDVSNIDSEAPQSEYNEKYKEFISLCENLGRLTVHTINHPNDYQSKSSLDSLIIELFSNYSEEEYAQNKIRQYRNRFKAITGNYVANRGLAEEMDKKSETQCFCIVWVDDIMYMKVHGTKEEIETKVTPIVARLKINGEDVKITFTTEPKPVTVDVDDEGNMKLRRG